MEFVWAGEREKENAKIKFSLRIKEACDTLVICAADCYTVFLDGKFVAYGPERTAAGYSRVRNVPLNGAKTVEIRAVGYNVNCYAFDRQKPFFGALIKRGEEVVYGTADFSCVKENCAITKTTRFSGQRGFVEAYDFRDKTEEPLSPYAVLPPLVINGIGDTCKYPVVNFAFSGESAFRGFARVQVPSSEKIKEPSLVDAYAKKHFLERDTRLFQEKNFVLEWARTGFLKLEIEAEEETEFFALMEEYVPEEGWVFRRSGCNDFIHVKVPEGRTEFLSAEPYAFRYLKIVYKGKMRVVPTLVALENANADFVSVEGDEKLCAVFEAARNSFAQNAVDVFTDCPGRERAGWLCDSYFEGKVEQLFTGKNEVERAFLENFVLCNTPELPQGMLPKCFPSEHRKDHYIPNWAMWFVIELEDYFDRTGDRGLVDAAKKKAYDLVTFFERYVNEYGLLEDLESWVFVEWSVSNDPEYLRGVNFPSNMLFARMLECMDKLYGDELARARAQKIKEAVLRLSFDGEFFADNAVRKDGALVRCDDHISETCQYYALFFGMKVDEAFKEKIKKEFGPFRKDKYPQIGRSNMFIGNYLRLFWLLEEKEYDRALDESVGYFYEMAKKTGTLWEHNSPHSSCNHGFASVAAHIILRAAKGYLTVKDGKPVFENEGKGAGRYALNVKFRE